MRKAWEAVRARAVPVRVVVRRINHPVKVNRLAPMKKHIVAFR